MPEVRQRTVRLHAVREGDEFHFEHKWWVVKAHDVKSGEKFSGFDKKTNEPLTQTVPEFNHDRECGLWLGRGRVSTVVTGPRNSLVKIIRRPK